MMVKKKKNPQMTFRTDEKKKKITTFVFAVTSAEESINANNKYANYYLGHSFKSLSNME